MDVMVIVAVQAAWGLVKERWWRRLNTLAVNIFQRRAHLHAGQKTNRQYQGA
jgi:hypothetical protein